MHRFYSGLGILTSSMHTDLCAVSQHFLYRLPVISTIQQYGTCLYNTPAPRCVRGDTRARVSNMESLKGISCNKK